METELKLVVVPEQFKQFMQVHALEPFVATAPETQKLFAIYFDTDQQDLRSRQIGLRVRQHGNLWVQTIKAGGRVDGGLHRRNEWEQEVEGPWPRLDVLSDLEGIDSDVAKVLRRIRRAKELHEQFTVNVKRTVWLLRGKDAMIEVALDEGAILFQGKQVPVAEVEFELKSGDYQSLYEIATRIAGQVPLYPEERSKAQRGFALRESRLLEPPKKARVINLEPGWTVELGMQQVLLGCLQHAQANVFGVLESDAPEYLHQMRVGLRRFRSALKLFSTWIALPEPMQATLAWLGELLGAARDREVLSHSTLPSLSAKGPDRFGVRQLAEQIATDAQAAREAARNALRSTRYTHFIVSLFGWIEGAQWRAHWSSTQNDTARQSLEKFVQQAICAGRKKINKRSRNLARLDSEALHRLRIACKQNRYAVEFFMPLLSPKKAEKYVQALSSLQDVLGRRNDIAVASRIVDALQDEHPVLRPAAAFVAGYWHYEAVDSPDGLQQAWLHFARRSARKLFQRSKKG